MAYSDRGWRPRRRPDVRAAVNPKQHQTISDFARHILGCQCAEEVFRSIQLVDIPAVAGYPCQQIVIGGRLLIHVITGDNAFELIGSIQEIAVSGIRKRDQEGYNRFRLVVSLANCDGEALLRAEFLKSVGGDDKAHLHLVMHSEVPDLNKQNLGVQEDGSEILR